MLFGAFLVALGAFGSYFFGKQDAEKKEKQAAISREQDQRRIAELQDKLAAIQTDTSSIPAINQKIDKLLFQSTEGPHEEWQSIKMIEVAPWFGGEGIDHIFLVFKSSSGVIDGKIRIEGADEIYSFSTLINSTLPIAVRNLWLPEKKHFRKLPTIQYKITRKSIEKAMLSIVMVGAHGVGEHSVINLERPVKMKK
ncbi:MAG: hypothetical protein H8E10_06020 [Desulfobacterales bacterium]|nr:hypothetical protein [Desulfobacterales bacterium]